MIVKTKEQETKELLIDFYSFVDHNNIGIFRHSSNVTIKKYMKSIKGNKKRS